MPQTQDAQLVVRLPQDMLDRVDAFTERMQRELPGSFVRRAEAVRMLLIRGLNEFDKTTSKPKGGK